MDFSTIFQLRTKKIWWVDVIFYFVISLLVATVFCYLIFLVKDGIQRRDIKDQEAKLGTVGTDEDKNQEKEVISYQKKISDFIKLVRAQEFTSNVFAFVEQETLPSIWFKQFNMNEQAGQLQLSGEADTMETFSRQVAAFEKNKYVKSMDLLNSSLGEGARIQFNLNLTLNTEIFNYISENSSENSEGAEINSENMADQEILENLEESENLQNPEENSEIPVIPTR